MTTKRHCFASACLVSLFKTTAVVIYMTNHPRVDLQASTVAPCWGEPCNPLMLLYLVFNKAFDSETRETSKDLTVAPFNLFSKRN